MTPAESLLTTHYSAHLSQAGELIGAIGLLLNGEEKLPRSYSSLMCEFASVAGYSLLGAPEETLLITQKVFKDLVCNTIREKISQESQVITV